MNADMEGEHNLEDVVAEVRSNKSTRDFLPRYVGLSVKINPSAVEAASSIQHQQEHSKSLNVILSIIALFTGCK